MVVKKIIRNSGESLGLRIIFVPLQQLFDSPKGLGSLEPLDKGRL